MKDGNYVYEATCPLFIECIFVGDPEIFLLPISEVTDGEVLDFLLPDDLDMRRMI